MIKVNIPSNLTDSLGLNLLSEALPREITRKEITRLDFMGKSALTERRDYKEGFVYKAVAALGYEELQDKKNIAFCYCRAGKSALECNMPNTAIVCSARAIGLYPYIIAETNDLEEKDKQENEMLYFLMAKLTDGVEMYKSRNYGGRIKRLEECEHNWFTIIKDAVSA